MQFQKHQRRVSKSSRPLDRTISRLTIKVKMDKAVFAATKSCTSFQFHESMALATMLMKDRHQSAHLKSLISRTHQRLKQLKRTYNHQELTKLKIKIKSSSGSTSEHHLAQIKTTSIGSSSHCPSLGT